MSARHLITVYGISGFINLCYCLVRSRLRFPGTRLIRFPFEIRNRKYIKLGRKLTTGVGCRFEAHPVSPGSGHVLEFGDNVEVNDYVHIVARESVKIGNNVLMASKIFITDLNHGDYGNRGKHDDPAIPPSARALSSAPVNIEDNVWIGEFVSILPGVTIGKGSIIGTMSVVSKSIPPNSIAVGSPAKVVKSFDPSTGKWVSA
jgi:lipopolysaccharide O-acetyltransferase